MVEFNELQDKMKDTHLRQVLLQKKEVEKVGRDRREWESSVISILGTFVKLSKIDNLFLNDKEIVYHFFAFAISLNNKLL